MPTAIALVNLGVNAALDALLYKPIGIGGIPLSTAIVSLLTTVALMCVMRRRIGDIELRQTVETGLRIALAGVALAAVAFACEQALDGALSDSFVAQLVLVVVSGAAGLAVYAPP